MQGIVLVDKPSGWTSFDVVNFVRRRVAAQQGTKPKNTKVGHTGTLDPLATGLLVLLVGKEYTRQAAEFNKKDKVYEVVAHLGSTSTTGDAEGELTAVSDIIPSRDEVEAALQKFTGTAEQMPPAFSAKKVNGVRAYKLARSGQPVELKPIKVQLYDNILTSFEYPELRFTSHVSSGTYIRSLVEDLGKELGTGAYMSGLRRTKVGDFDIVDAVLPDDFVAKA